MEILREKASSSRPFKSPLLVLNVFNMHKQWEEHTLYMPRRQTVTLRHVAEAANVSIAAASRALSGNGYVNEETRQRVLEQARLLRYRIRGAARSLRSGKSGLIGLIIPNNENVFFTGIAQRLEDIFYEHGYCLLKGSSRGEREREAEYVARMVSHGIEGMIYIVASNRAMIPLTDISQLSIPIIVMDDRSMKSSNLDTVTCDNSYGVQKAIDYLSVLGHREIGFVKGSTTTTARDRSTAFIEGMRRLGLPTREEYIFPGDYTVSSGRKAAETLLNMDPLNRPTGILASNDMMAIGLLDTLKNQGVRIPEDISIIGYDDIPFCELISPRLTTVRQPIDEMAKEAVNLLFRRINMKQPNGEYPLIEPINREVRPILVERDSCTYPSRV
jgi:LacI family transcriptional regulator